MSVGVMPPKISSCTLLCQDANVFTNDTDRITLVLTYRPFNNHVKKILLTNFNILMRNPPNRFFPLSLSILSMHPEHSRYSYAHFYAKSVWVSGQHIMYPCGAPRCLTACTRVSTTTDIEGPRHNITIRENFTCKSSNVVHCISCCRCQALYTGETGRTHRERTGEHLRAVVRIPAASPVVEHFNKLGHRLDDMVVHCMKQ